MFRLLLILLCACVPSVVRAQGSKTNGKEYDYIIVGAGSAGAVVANRLSEDPNMTVLLLEAGGRPPSDSDVPLIVGKLYENNQTEWGYHTEPQENACRGLPGKRSFWSRYKALGGCSGHNYMVYNRGNHKDYDHWEEQGASGWAWKDVKPFFMKSEDHTIKENLSNGYHGTSGYLTVSSIQYRSKLREAYTEAMKSLGYKTVDYNGPSQTGVSDIQVTQRHGRRCSTNKAFLEPVRSRKNLRILTHARVLKIVFDGDKRARSIVYDRKNSRHLVSARKEIVLCAGAIGTPQLLMLSGVGPKEHLRDLGIPLVVDLPVGQNLQDHVSAGGMLWKLNQSVGLVYNRDVNTAARSEYSHGKGPLTSPGTLENMIYVFSKYQNSTEDWPDIQIQTASSMVLIQVPGYENQDVTTITPILLRPESRGEIRLRSTDPYVDPIMDPKYFSVKKDLQVLIEGMKFSRKLIKTESLQRLGPEPILEAVPQCLNLNWDSEDYLECTARSLSLTYYHPCCTAKMGQFSDNTTVVDPQLRVKGVKGLRVADASVMPTLPSANTNAACIMIGEKAASMIKSSTNPLI